MARRVTAGHEALRQSEHPSATAEPTHDVVAVDTDGDVVFETESLFDPDNPEDALADYPSGDNAPDGVDHYEVRER